MKYGNDKNFELLKGSTLTAVRRIDDEEIIFETTDGKSYRMYHQQDCCESVRIHTMSQNIDDVISSPITVAKETVDSESVSYGSCTMTTYTLATDKGAIVIIWRGESNGYYSESVSFVEC